MEKAVLFYIDVEIGVTAKGVHRTVDHRSSESAVLRSNAPSTNVVRMTVIAVEFDPGKQRARPVVRFDRRGAVGDDDAIGLQAADHLAVPQFEEFDRARRRRTERPIMRALVAPPAAPDDNLAERRPA